MGHSAKENGEQHIIVNFINCISHVMRQLLHIYAAYLLGFLLMMRDFRCDILGTLDAQLGRYLVTLSAAGQVHLIFYIILPPRFMCSSFLHWTFASKIIIM
jgi:hypothetical protein